MARKRRSFTAEFKDEAVKLVLERGLTIAQAAQDLDLGESTLGRWVQKARPDGPEEPLSWSEREELRRLRRENERLREREGNFKKSRGLLRQGEPVTAYQFIDDEKASHAIVRLCTALGVSRSGFYDWKAREPSNRHVRDRKLVTHIRAAHARSRGTYGRPRVHAELVDQGVQVGQRRIGRLMRQEGLTGIPRKRFRVTTTADDNHKVANNVLDRKFSVDHPNEAWVTDITYVQVGAQWLYLAAILDLFSRKVVGWAAEAHLRTDLCLQALRAAVAIRRPDPGLVHHSDRGCQYTSKEYQAELHRHGIVPSMSRKGDCWDNAVAESFFGTLKTELVHRRAFRTLAEARQALSNYIHGFYNAERRHSTIGRVSPDAFEKHARQAHSGSAG